MLDKFYQGWLSKMAWFILSRYASLSRKVNKQLKPQWLDYEPFCSRHWLGCAGVEVVKGLLSIPYGLLQSLHWLCMALDYCLVALLMSVAGQSLKNRDSCHR
jgi:hypothetical protein